ncbi:DUF2285 domain-containing protein [Bradyrhizobium sp. CCGUVB4N]|uniref:DNA -binding domain-containing protein n=1 Tax=Bradyrhizobium sp. CCGUVB4N TaxID=2949631 RepID=UPI0020B1D306|nr:DUF2285 domain-containing protein [Bradyrhizobium sp. CCGUVB4N]MCP3381243.1 DUF2285 domain-containing protein [Bradyrhizobium sp. CCGUVB4N]
MQKIIPLGADVAEIAPSNPAALTPYDHSHITTYLRMLHANAEGADWRKVAQIILHIDAEREPARAKQAYESHLARAKWMTEYGYKLVLSQGWPSLS